MSRSGIMNGVSAQSEPYWKIIHTFIPDTILLLDENGVILFVNRTHYFSKKDLLGTTIFDHYLPDCRKLFRRKFLEVKETGKKAVFELNLTVRGKEERYFCVAAGPIVNRKRVTGFVVRITDITERNRAEQLLRESEYRYRTLAETLNEGVWVIDKRGMTVYVNETMAAMLGYAADEMREGRLFTFVKEQDAARCKSLLKRRTRGVRECHEFGFVRKDGSIVHTLLAVAPLADNKGIYGGAIAGVLDITDRKNMENDLRATQDQLRMLTAHLHSAREQERTSIAREIHDELGQALTALKLDLSWFFKNNPAEDTVKSGFFKQIDAVLATVKRIVFELRPPLISELGFKASLEWHIAEFQKRTGSSCTVALDLEDADMPNDMAIALFRIVQEALTNTARHAHASKITIKMQAAGNILNLEIHDNGIGISPEKISGISSLGLTGIRERVLSFNGTVRIEGNRGKGTSLHIAIPLNGK